MMHTYPCMSLLYSLLIIEYQRMKLFHHILFIADIIRIYWIVVYLNSRYESLAIKPK